MRGCGGKAFGKEGHNPLNFVEQVVNSTPMAPVPSTPTPREFGKALAELRAERGVSLDDIIQRTKIARRTLEALERGEFRALPERVFVKMFLRQCLALMKEPAEAWLEAFDRAYDRFEHSSQTFPAVQLPPVRRPRTWPWLLALTFVAAGVAFLLSLSRPRAGLSGTGVPPTPEVLLGELLARTTPAPVATAEPTPTPQPSTLLLIQTSGRPCWVEVDVTGLGRFQRLVAANARWEIETGGLPVDLRVGDAGAVTVEYLGVTHSALGKAGEVARVHLDGAAGTP